MLERFGFTPTESRVYQELLKSGPATGYVIARDLGIARANVYQALESLHRRGAARKSSTSPIQYSAVGPSALLAELERSFRKDLSQLEEGLRALPLAPSSGLDLEQLLTADQLLARAASFVDSARAEVLAVTGAWAAPLNARLAAASRRRIQLRAVALSEPVPDGAVSRIADESQLRAYWGGLPVAVVADRDRAVCGVIDGERASGVASTMPGLIPWLRHLIRRELASSSEPS